MNWQRNLGTDPGTLERPDCPTEQVPMVCQTWSGMERRAPFNHLGDDCLILTLADRLASATASFGASYYLLFICWIRN